MDQAIAFVLSAATKRCVGSAFLVQNRTLMTCAHVINTAIGRDPRDPSCVPQGTSLMVEFVTLGGEFDRVLRWADVIGWRPEPEGDFEMNDVALLRINETVDAYGGEPLILSSLDLPAVESKVDLIGPSPGGRMGQRTEGKIQGAVGKNRYQIDEPERRVVPGYSGGPVCDRRSGDVIGMVQAVPRDRESPDVYILTAPLLREVTTAVEQSPPGPAPRPGEGHLSDHAELHYDGTAYRLRQVRHLYNGGQTPVTDHEFKVAVEHNPYDEKGLIAEHHAQHHLVRSDEYQHRFVLLELEASYELHRPGVGQSGHPDLGVRKEIPHSRITTVKFSPQVIEARLLFPGSSPLTTGAEAIVEYCYRVSDDKWGQWFQRNIKPNTEQLSVDIHLPANLKPECWGMSLSPSNSIVTVLPGVTARRTGDNVVFSWKGNAAAGDALTPRRRIRLEWFFWSEVLDSAQCQDAATVLGRFGIRQIRSPRRSQAVDPEHLPPAVYKLGDSPEDRAITRHTLAHLKQVAGWVGRFHRFDSAVSRGLAAPQLGMAFPVLIVSQPADGKQYDDVLFRDGWLEMVNPRIVEQTKQVTTEFEGCLSFFDFRGPVIRPWGIRVVYDGSDGVQEFTGTLARSIHHEIDHLRGILYTNKDRMAHHDKPIPVGEYRSQRQQELLPVPDPPRGKLDWRPPDQDPPA